MKIVIADTSCLIIYDKINKLHILKETFLEIRVTPEVAEEYGSLPEWVQISKVNNQKEYLQLKQILGKGEASSIALALENMESILIIDEKKGRKIARELGVEIIGSLGTLLKSKEKGVINSVRGEEKNNLPIFYYLAVWQK